MPLGGSGGGSSPQEIADAYNTILMPMDAMRQLLDLVTSDSKGSHPIQPKSYTGVWALLRVPSHQRGYLSTYLQGAREEIRRSKVGKQVIDGMNAGFWEWVRGLQ
jgi:hypothetical protein